MVFLETWCLIALFLVLIIYWAVRTTASLMGLMRKAPPPGLPESVVGRYTIEGTIFAFGTTIVFLAAMSAIYVFYRRPQVPYLAGIEIRPVARASQCYEAWTVKTPIIMALELEFPILQTTNQARPSTIVGRNAKPDEEFKVVGGPWQDASGCYWLLEDKTLERGWLPERYQGRPVLRSRN